MDEPSDELIEWREQIGQRLMMAMTCNHGADYFGSGAVCETCFANVQRIGRIVESEVRKRSTHALATGTTAARESR